MAGNMESMLMGRSDSSSDDDSGDEALVVGTLGSAAAAVAVSLPRPAPTPAPAASTPPPPQPAAPALKIAPAAPAPAAAPPGAAPVAAPISAPAPPPAAATTPPRVAAVTATVARAPSAQQLRQAAANNPSTAAPTAPPGANPSEVSRRLKAASGQALMAMPSAATPASTAPPPKPAGVPMLPPMPKSVRPGMAPPGASQPAAQPGVINPSATGRPAQQQQREERRRQAERRAVGLPPSLPPPGGAVAPQQQQMSTATAVPAAAAGRGAQHHPATGVQQLAATVPQHLQQKQPQPVDTNRVHEAKHNEKLFFKHILMKYLEEKDSAMHSKAKAVIKECEEKNKAGDAAYASLTNSMQTRLRQTVGEAYWKKAEDYLNHLFTRVLMKYLEKKDLATHSKAKAVIKECEERKKAGDAAYASLTNIMQTRLRQMVGGAYWKKAEDDLNQFLKRRAAEEQAAKQQAEAQRQASAAQQAQIDVQAKARAVAAGQHQQQPQPVRALVSSPISVAPSSTHNPSVFHSAAVVGAQQRQKQQQHQQPPPAIAHAQREREAKQQEEKFLMFIRELMKYLEQKDPAMHSKAKAVIKECAERNKAGDAAYAKLTESMWKRLRPTVGEAYWKKTEDHLRKATKEHATKHQATKQHTVAVQRQIDAQAKARAVAAGQQQRVPMPSTVAAQMQQQQQPQFQQQQATAASPSFSSVMKTAKSMSAKQIAHKKKQKAQKAVATRRPMQNSADANSAAASTTPAGTPALSATTAAAMPPATTTKKTQRKQTKKVPKAASAAAKAAATAKAKEDEPPKEYAELMEMVDHAIRYDWSSAALLLGKEYKSEVNLAEEQRRLLYGEGGAGALGRPGAAQAATAIVTSASVSESAAAAPRTEFERHATATKAAAGLPPTQSQPSDKLPPAARGWDKRNVLSVRAAWAKLRLPEREALHLSGGTGRSGPTAGLRPLPGAAAAQQPKTNKPSLVPQAQPPCETEWFNEDRAKEDKSLALLSEATELYLKSVLEGAVSSARRRQNLDGVRLWHRQHVTNGDKSGGTSSSSTAALSASGGHPPEGSAALCLRLGCDVRRQAALAEGNAAKTVQRMEEALSRSKDLDAAGRNLRDDGTLYGAESMADLAQRPRLARASKTADRDAKRKFEVFGGKGSGAPPFGRVPKKVQILAKDLRPCLEDPSFPVRRLCVPRSIF